MYLFIIIPLIVAALSQAIKLIFDGIPNNFNWRHLISDYGGMPSCHTAYVTSLATIIGLVQGFYSATFAIAFVLMIVVIRDAIGFRMEIGKNAILTNYLAKKVIKTKKITLLTERIGHKPSEIIAGLLLGAALTVILYFTWMIISVN